MKLLVVDDATHVRERLVSALNEVEGIRLVAQASKARQAVRCFRSLQPDIVTLDLKLPGSKSGFELLQMIKQEAPATVVVIFTNCRVDQYRDLSFEAGADHFFHKQTGLKNMLRAVESIARRLKLERKKNRALSV